MKLNLVKTRHFDLHELSPGVYAAIATSDGLAMCNAGFVNLGNRTILFDTFLNLDAARELLTLAEDLTKNKVTHIINSHFHLDHVVGNQLFGSDVTILCSPATYEVMKEQLPKNYTYFTEQGPTLLAENTEKLKTATDPKVISELKNDAIFLQALVGYELIPRLPDLTLENKLTLYGTERTVEILAFPLGHTKGDLALYLPAEGIVFMGDLLCINNHPWIGHGDPDELAKVLQHFAGLGLKHVIPGHGPVGTSADLLKECQYLTDLRQLVEKAVAEGKKPEDICLESLPAAYREWESPVCIQWNVDFLYQRLIGQEQ